MILAHVEVVRSTNSAVAKMRKTPIKQRNKEVLETIKNVLKDHKNKRMFA